MIHFFENIARRSSSYIPGLRYHTAGSPLRVFSSLAASEGSPRAHLMTDAISKVRCVVPGSPRRCTAVRRPSLLDTCFITPDGKPLPLIVRLLFRTTADTHAVPRHVNGLDWRFAITDDILDHPLVNTRAIPLSSFAHISGSCVRMLPYTWAGTHRNLRLETRLSQKRVSGFVQTSTHDTLGLTDLIDNTCAD